MMTNKEKSNELAVNYKVTLNDVKEGFQEQIVEQACMRMALWKDKQLRLTPDDIDVIFNLVITERKKHADQKGCYQDVIKLFYEQKNC